MTTTSVAQTTGGENLITLPNTDWDIAWDPASDIPPSSDWDIFDADAAWDVPSEEDERWYLSTREFRGMRILDAPTDADIEEAYQISAMQDAIERGLVISDADIEACGLAIG